MLQFRRATVSDIPVLGRLAERIWREYYPAIIGQAQVDYMLPRMYSAEVIRGELANETVWEIASDEDSIIGFCSISLEPDGRAKLHKLYLDPQRHGRGFGQQLIQRAIEIGRELGGTTLWLQVNKQNTRAIRAYERAGFNIDKATVFDIGGGFVMDDFVMAKAL